MRKLRRWRKVCFGTLLIYFLFSTSLLAQADVPDITASAAVLLDACSGTLLYARHPHTRRPPASTTKILTGILALELGNPEDVVTVSRRASCTEGSSIYLEEGERIPLEDLVFGALLQSGNDACVAIAEHLGGTEAVFVELMNRKAKAIGAWDTHFVNPHGLPAPDHYSTAFDLALMARYALRNRKFQEIVRQKTKLVQWGGKEWKRYLESTNQLLWDYEGADGVKTGTTLEAGPCLVASATREGRQLIAVVLNSADRWWDSAHLLDYGFECFILLCLARQGEQQGEVKVASGMLNRVPVVAARDLYVAVPRDKRESLERVVVLQENPIAPLDLGEVLGEIRVLLSGEVIRRVPLVAGYAVQRRTPLRLFLLRWYIPLLKALNTWRLL